LIPSKPITEETEGKLLDGLLNIQEIAQRCLIAQGCDAQTTIQEIEKLKNDYNFVQLTEIYNNFLLLETDPAILSHIVKEINSIRHPDSLPVLIDYLITKKDLQKNDDYLNVRTLMVKTISNFKDTSAVMPLMYCLNDKEEHYKMRLCCAEALGRIGDKYAVMPSIDVVTDEEEKSVYLRESAAVALGMIGDVRALDPLLNILEGKKGFVDKFTFLKERIIEAIGKFNFNNDRVFKALKNSLEDESAQIRINAIEALMNSEDERAEGLIRKMLCDNDEEVVRNAVIALYNISDKSVLEEIIEGENFSPFAKTAAQEIYDEYETDEE
jgi:HEAT repeat protein